VEMKLPHVADAAGAISKQVDNIKHAAILFIGSSLKVLLKIENTRFAPAKCPAT
jgi:hypothetical protein